MSLALILLKQITVMFLLMAVGYGLFKAKKITLQGNRELGTFLIYIILPAAVIKSYITEFTQEKLAGLFLSFIAAIGSLIVAILLSRLVFGSRHKIEHFGTAFSNAGFMGIPLVKAVVGDQAVFYIAAFVALLNILQWTYGVAVMSGSRESVSLKKLATNPVVIALCIGLFLFATQLKVPGLLTDTLGLLGNMTAPVAMITLGVYLAQMRFGELFHEKWSYASTILRLVIIPLVTLALLTLLPAQYGEVRLTVLIAAAAPVGSNVAIFSQLNGLDYTRAVKSICLSTMLSIITMPMLVGLAVLVWK
ncbi:MAG TPA: hypothetical protein GXX75_11920 [Clostridiales bacterium]|nr:hypothetical protein [Clostridiales bacterium]